MIKHVFICIFICISTISCTQNNPNKSIDEGRVKNDFYTSDEIGWTIEIPKGWKITNKDVKNSRTQKGADVIEDVVDEKIDFTAMKELIGFEKNDFNIFQSSSEPFDLKYEGEWEENNAAIKSISYAAIVSQGIKVDSSATTIEKIDGLDFHSFSFTIYSPKGEVILKQIIFSRLINGLGFGVNINYNNDKDRDEMLNAFRSSKFKIVKNKLK